MSIAILDLGTNTFNLLIAEKETNLPFAILHNSTKPVKLGRGGIHNNTILPDAIDRAFLALDAHLETIRTFEPTTIIAFATSAIRTADNGAYFANDVKNKYGIELKVISGDKEAELIYYGIKASINRTDKTFLILDIGGGSNEFIIGNSTEIFWKESFPLGIARLIAQFPPSNPVTLKEIQLLENYFDSKLESLLNAFKLYMPIKLIGASGTFDTLLSLLIAAYPEKYFLRENYFSNKIELNDYFEIHNLLLKSTFEERKLMNGLDSARIEMIVYASIFVNYIFKRLSITELTQSDFSLKEGAAWCLFNGIEV